MRFQWPSPFPANAWHGSENFPIILSEPRSHVAMGQNDSRMIDVFQQVMHQTYYEMSQKPSAHNHLTNYGGPLYLPPVAICMYPVHKSPKFYNSLSHSEQTGLNGVLWGVRQVRCIVEFARLVCSHLANNLCCKCDLIHKTMDVTLISQQRLAAVVPHTLGKENPKGKLSNILCSLASGWRIDCAFSPRISLQWYISIIVYGNIIENVQCFPWIIQQPIVHRIGYCIHSTPWTSVVKLHTAPVV